MREIFRLVDPEKTLTKLINGQETAYMLAEDGSTRTRMDKVTICVDRLADEVVITTHWRGEAVGDYRHVLPEDRTKLTMDVLIRGDMPARLT